LAQGHLLLIVDDFNDFYAPEIKRRNLSSVRKLGTFKVVEAEICDSDRMTCVFEDFAPEVVVHLAARAGVRPSLEQPLLYEKTNVHGTLLLLDLARKHGVQKFVFASSSSVYGSTSRVPFSEEVSDLYPISPYGVTKLAGEKLCYCYSRIYKLPVVCLRFFTVYGPRQRPDLAIHKFVRLIEANREIPFFGDGSSLRDYTFINDILDGIVAAMKLDSQFEVINLGNSHPISLLELLHLLEQKLGKTARIKHLPVQPGDMLSTHADLTKAHRLLSYEPRVPFEEGIGRFVHWFRNDVS
jgi:UDP-glucuronate 4-epimerase